MQRDFDVFLSYHWRDQHQVKDLAGRLRDRGIAVFLDRWYLMPGESWLVALEAVLARCRSVVVCVGAGEMGSWQQRETQLALSRQVEVGRGGQRFPVIPVLLPGAESPLGFLGQHTWVDLRTDPRDELMLQILQRAIDGEPPGPDIEARVGETLITVSPFKGLSFFREEDAPLFFGRDAAVDALASKLARRNLVALVGTSGSGKSSVVRAGLIPRLRSDLAEPWEIATIVPNDRPLYNLAAALLQLLESDLAPTDRLIRIGGLAEALEHGSLHVRDIVEEILRKQPGTRRFLLVVDQWEELYTLTKSDAARRRFVDDLLQATEAKSLSVVVTLRGDFVGHALRHRGLADRLQDAQVNLGPMRRDELRLAIAKPAAKVNGAFEPGLVERILDDVGDEPGHLPLLEFVLQRTWDDALRSGRLMRHKTYEAIGGVEGALSCTADTTYEKLSDRERRAIERLFLQLVRPAVSSENSDTRRRATFDEIDHAGRELVASLADARLLVTGFDAVSQKETVEVAHEALIRHWQRLKDWLDRDREFLLWRERLRSEHADWCRSRDPDALLRGARLAEAERWQSQRGGQLSAEERDYISRGAELRAKQTAQDKRKTRVIIGVSLAATVAVSIFAYRAETQRALIQKLLVDARGLAEPIVLTIEDDLKRVAGTAAVRTRLLGEANKLLDRLSQYDASDPQTLHTLLWGKLKRGDLATSRGELGLARELYSDAFGIAENLVKADQKNSEWLRDLSVGYNKLGDIEYAESKLDAARKAYEESRRIREQLAMDKPEDWDRQRDLSLSFEKLGNVEFKEDKLDKARKAYEVSRRIREQLAEKAKDKPEHWDRQHDLSVIYNKLGDIDLADSKHDDARKTYEQSLQIRKKLVSIDDRNEDWQRGLSLTYMKLADVSEKQGRRDLAQKELKDALIISKRLTKIDDQNAQWKHDVRWLEDRLDKLK